MGRYGEIWGDMVALGAQAQSALLGAPDLDVLVCEAEHFPPDLPTPGGVKRRCSQLGGQPSSQKRKAEDELEDDRTKPSRPSGPDRQEQDGDGDEQMTGQGQEADNSVSMDAVWRTKQSTVWDMRHDGGG